MTRGEMGTDGGMSEKSQGYRLEPGRSRANVDQIDRFHPDGGRLTVIQTFGLPVQSI